MITRIAMATAIVVLWAAGPASGQLSDLQPGPNFPDGSAEFGNGVTESVDFGDVDNDGDLDVVAGNGGDNGPQQSRIYLNQGGLQGGSAGTFVDATAALFGTTVHEATRDMEFADIDQDGDLDLLEVNRGTTAVGAVSRWYVNQGGLQGGTLAQFVEDTDARWGTLVSVPGVLEVGVVDGSGPFGGWSCDCDFGDLDDDGDLDLFVSSYGPSMNGAGDSRIFLNDGSGVFDELWPWADPAADIRLHTLDIDLADFDGDFDLDVFASSRDSQARVYCNNLYGPLGPTPFQDITQTAIYDTGAMQMGSSNYDAEYGDLDGDGDFDVWAINYAGGGSSNLDRILRNDGVTPGAGFRFVREDLWIKGDPNASENEIDFLDYDGDGDLDAWLSNFFGTNYLYASGLTQGLEAGTQGLFHRAGTSSNGSLATWPETGTNNSGTTRDGDTGDLDNDGDPDIALAQDANQANRLLTNLLGVPDTHAPTFYAGTAQCDKPAGTETVVHAAVRDNSDAATVGTYACQLVYSVDAGPEQVVAMFSQGGMQFRAVIPPVVGVVSYRFECTDRTGNTGISPTQSFTQAGPTWTAQAGGSPGLTGVPLLVGTGTWQAGTAGSLALTNARPAALAGLFYGLTAGPVPLAGGQLVPFPFLGPIVLATTPAGTVDLGFGFPVGIPCGTEIFLQFVLEDAAAVGGYALSNGVRAVTP